MNQMANLPRSMKAVFFDMDGVLYDSMPLHERAWRDAFATEGIDFPAVEAYRNEGRTGRSTINIVYQSVLGREAEEIEIERIYSRKSELMRQQSPASMMKGMLQLISNLRDRNVRVIVVTGSKQPSLMERLERDYGFVRCDVISGADVKIGKPDPEPYLIAIQRVGFSVAECCVVENAPLGIRSAKAAGLFTIAINSGKLPDTELLQENCDLLFQSSTALVDAWRDVL